MSETRKYRLLRGHVKGIEAGGVVELDVREAHALRLSVEPVEDKGEAGTSSQPLRPGSSPPEAAAEDDPAPPTVPSVAELLKDIAAAVSRERLAEIAAEEAGGRNRVTVFRAVDSRREELETEEAEA